MEEDEDRESSFQANPVYSVSHRHRQKKEEDYLYMLDKILQSVNLQQIGTALHPVPFVSGFSRVCCLSVFMFMTKVLKDVKIGLRS